ncbi:unnamed protein product, partial [Iphiclides podalirius]
MSKPVEPEAGLREVRVDVRRPRHPVPYGGKVPKTSERNPDFVYVNPAYVGSLNSVSDARVQQPPTSVIREQYWTCSKWSFAQRIMAIAVGVLSGAVIGLALTIALRSGDTDVIGGLFRSHPAPD